MIKTKMVINIHRPPIAYFGQKWALYEWIKDYLPIHSERVDLFGGGGALSTLLPPCDRHVWNDLYKPSVNFFRVLKADPDALIQNINNLLDGLTLDELKQCCKQFKISDLEPEQQAARFYLNSHLSFAQTGTQAHTGWTTDNRKLSQDYLNPTYLWAVAARWRSIQIYNLDFRQMLTQTPATMFVYADPPYVWSCRKSKDSRHPNSDRPCRKYAHELGDADHVELIRLLQGRPVLLSGFWSELYADCVPRDWQIVSKRIQSDEIEYLWISPEAWERQQQLKLELA